MTAHILASTDFSDASRPGVAEAGALARKLGASLTLVHVWDRGAITTPPAPPGGAPEGRTFAREVRRAIEERLHEARALVPEGVEVTEVLLEGASPARALARHAEEIGADLLVLSTHGRTGFERLLLGSVAEKVVRLAHCPVMTVPARPDGG